MKTVDLEELKVQFKGRRFCELVSHHLRRQNQAKRIEEIKGTVALLPEVARGLAEGFIDRWNICAYDKEFWQRDTANVFGEIIDDAQDALRPLGLAGDDEAAFNLFNLVVLSYAYSAYDQPKMHKFAGIDHVGFPWLSTITLLYPVGAAVYISTVAQPLNCAIVIGYGLAQLGYLLFAAGIFFGTFRALGLLNRWQVFGVAVLSFVLGTVLSNIGS